MCPFGVGGVQYPANAVYCPEVAPEHEPSQQSATAGAATSGAAARRAPGLFRAVGSRVRELRLEQRFTLDELSARSGVSRRMITMLEGGEANVSLGTLDKLARALDCDFATLVAVRRIPPLTPEQSRTVDPVWEDDSGSSARLLLADSVARVTELWQWQLMPGARYEADADPAGSEEILLVHTGQLVVEVVSAGTGPDEGGERYELGAGSYLRLPTDTPYAYVNSGRSVLRFVRLILMP